MNRLGRWIFILIALSLSAVGGYYIAYNQYVGTGGEISKPRCTLRTHLRKLWADHVIWVRDYIIAAAAESPDAQPATDRLLKNQEDLGNTFIPYYGKEAGQKLTKLLKDHVSIATEVITAAKASNQSKLKESDQKWHANALEIAEFLSNANPHWPHDMLVKMLNAHIALTTDEATARLNKNWKDDIISFDKSFEQILDMADHITEGIVAQFPHKF